MSRPLGVEVTQIQSAETALRLAVVRRAFTRRRHGHDTNDVDEMLATVSKLADDLLRETEGTSRQLAAAEAALIGTRAELAELREAAAATEQLLAGMRAELVAERRARARDPEAEERLVKAEAELRLLRATLDVMERALADARRDLVHEQAGRTATEQRLTDVSSQLAVASAERTRDVFAEVGGEIAGLLRAGAEAAEAARQRSQRAADTVLAEAEELAAAWLEDAEARAAEAEDRARCRLEAASAEAARILSEAVEAARAQGAPWSAPGQGEEAACSSLTTEATAHSTDAGPAACWDGV